MKKSKIQKAELVLYQKDGRPTLTMGDIVSVGYSPGGCDNINGTIKENPEYELIIRFKKVDFSAKKFID